MGLQLGPGFLRRPPAGWLPARASAVAHRAGEWPTTTADGGSAEIETSCWLDARWRVELPGREPYEFDEERRTAPTWASGGLMGGGRRWYKVRVARSYGLMDGVAFPCFVDPGDAHRIWIDWDAAYDAHSEAWGRHARVERELARRENAWEYAVERVMNPFAGRLQDGELEIAERTHRERKAAAAEQERRMRMAARGRECRPGVHHLQGGDGRDQAQRRGARADPPHRAQDDRHGGRAAGDRPAARPDRRHRDRLRRRRRRGGPAGPPRAPPRTARGQALQARADRHGVDRSRRSGRDLPRSLSRAPAALARVAGPGIGLAGCHQTMTSERGCR